ncbi:MAG: hypothetical protein U5M53_02480 [Rhodoferax sp.]|nr:hypothetical protein [Rhodoferax sp.]
MAGKRSKWATHLKAAEASGLSLVAYATKHKFDVRRLYEARQLRKLQGATAWSVVRVKEPVALAATTPQIQHRAVPSCVAMQARLGNGVVLTWAQDQTNAAALDTVLRTLAALPCSI